VRARDFAYQILITLLQDEKDHRALEALRKTETEAKEQPAVQRLQTGKISLKSRKSTKIFSSSLFAATTRSIVKKSRARSCTALRSSSGYACSRNRRVDDKRNSCDDVWRGQSSKLLRRRDQLRQARQRLRWAIQELRMRTSPPKEARCRAQGISTCGKLIISTIFLLEISHFAKIIKSSQSKILQICQIFPYFWLLR
jgi:hypothetical protein